MMGYMFTNEQFTIECGTCLAAGTTACNECVLTHLLANDDGPIDLLAVRLDAPVGPQARAVALFQRAGLVDDPVEFVPIDTFEALGSATALCQPALR